MCEGWVFQHKSKSKLLVAVIGGGKIGSAIALALRDCGYDVEVTARTERTVALLSSKGLRASNCNPCAARRADVVFIAVKPYHFPAVAREIRDYVKGKTVVSVMAAVTVKTLRESLPGAYVFRAMPNLNVRVKKSLTALASGEGEGFELVKRLLSCFGEVYVVPEELLDAWTAVAGSGPALVAEFVDALILASLSVGLPRELARDVVTRLLLTTAEYLLNNYSIHPAELRDEVTTPAGTTIAAIRILESKGFKSAVMDAVRDAAERAKEIARDINRMLQGL